MFTPVQHRVSDIELALKDDVTFEETQIYRVNGKGKESVSLFSNLSSKYVDETIVSRIKYDFPDAKTWAEVGKGLLSSVTTYVMGKSTTLAPREADKEEMYRVTKDEDGFIGFFRSDRSKRITDLDMITTEAKKGGSSFFFDNERMILYILTGSGLEKTQLNFI